MKYFVLFLVLIGFVGSAMLATHAFGMYTFLPCNDSPINLGGELINSFYQGGC